MDLLKHFFYNIGGTVVFIPPRPHKLARISLESAVIKRGTFNGKYNSLSPKKREDLASSYIQNLHKNRLIPVVPFGGSFVVACKTFFKKKDRQEFLAKVGSKSGIYLIEYKEDPNIYYIGQASNFRNRFNSHFQAKSQGKFHKLLRLVGRKAFNVYIVEVCPLEKLGERENYYLSHYKPILNTIYSTSTAPYKARVKVGRTLSSELLDLKKIFNSSARNRGGLPVYVLDLNVKNGLNAKGAILKLLS